MKGKLLTGISEIFSKMRKNGWMLCLGVLCAVVLNSETAFAQNAGDADGDGYCDQDVSVINSLIEEGVFAWNKDEPETWSVNWSTYENEVKVISSMQLFAEDFAEGGDVNLTALKGLYNFQSLTVMAFDKITGLDLSGLEDLISFTCDSNITLEWLKLDGLENLTTLSCQSCHLTSLDVSDLVNLEDFRCAMNYLTELDLTGLTKLGDPMHVWIPFNYYEKIIFPNGDVLTFDRTEGGYVTPWNVEVAKGTIELVPIPDTGYSFEEWASIPDGAIFKENGANTTVAGVRDTWTITVDGDVTVSAVFSSKSYQIINGADSVWNQGDSQELTITADGDFDKFMRVEIDDKILDQQYYSVREGSTIVDIAPEFLDTLSVGMHTVKIVFSDGLAMTQFEIKAPSNIGDISDKPGDTLEQQEQDNSGKQNEEFSSVNAEVPLTGDSPIVWLYAIFIAFATVSGLYVIAKIKKRDIK